MEEQPLLSIYHEDAFYQPLLERFSKNIGNYEKRLKTAVDDQNEAEIKNCAHEIKGVFGGYGFPQIAELANNVQVAYDGSSEMRQAVVQLIALVERVKKSYPAAGNE